MAKNENRNYVTMKCTECGMEIRPTSKNKKNNPDRLEIKRYCPKRNNRKLVNYEY